MSIVEVDFFTPVLTTVYSTTVSTLVLCALPSWPPTAIRAVKVWPLTETLLDNSKLASLVSPA